MSDLIEPAQRAQMLVDLSEPGVPVVRIVGDVDLSSGQWLRSALQLAAARGGPKVEVDLEEVTFIDPGGLRGLLGAARAARTTVRIDRPSEHVQRVFTALDLPLPLVVDGTDGTDGTGPSGSETVR